MDDNLAKTSKNYSAIIVSLLFAGSLLTAILGFESVRSFCFYLSIGIVLYFFLKDLFVGNVSGVLLFLLLMMACAVLIDFKLNFDYFKRVIIVFCVFISFTKINYFSKKTTDFEKKEISILFSILTAIIELYYYFGGLNKVFFGNTNLISLNMNNPNEAGMWLTCTFLILVSSIGIWKNVVYKSLLWILSAFLLPIIWATGSRNCMIACLLFIITFVFIKFFRIKKVNKLILFLVVVLPAIVFFVYMYIFIPYLGAFEDSLSGFVSEGKNLTSRSKIWQIVIDNFRNCFLLGDYAKYLDSQLHNSLATLYVMFGLPTTILMCFIMYKSLKRFSSEKNVLSTTALLCVLLTGCFEASLFVGVAGLFLVVLILPCFSQK